MTDEPTDTQSMLDELAWQRQRAALHGEWDEAARYAALLETHALPPDPALPVGRDCPEGYPIKARRATRLYHVPGGAWYPRMTPDTCFATEAAAQQAGYRRSRR
jgi:hypothetical protein